MIEIEKVEIDIRKLEAFAAQCNMSVDQALHATALQVEGLAKNRAPVDTGALKNSIHTEKASEMQYRIADGVEYGIYQELGTHKMAAQPFLIPSLRNAVQQIYNAVENEFKKALK